MTLEERKAIKDIAKLSLHDNGMKLPDDKKASTLKKLPNVKRASLPKDVEEDCEEKNYAKEVQASINSEDNGHGRR